MARGWWGRRAGNNCFAGAVGFDLTVVAVAGDGVVVGRRNIDYTTDSAQRNSDARRIVAAAGRSSAAMSPKKEARSYHHPATTAARSPTCSSASRAGSPRCSVDAR